MRTEDKIAIVLEELGLYDPSKKDHRLALKRAKKRVNKVLDGEVRREEESHHDALEAALGPDGQG